MLHAQSSPSFEPFHLCSISLYPDPSHAPAPNPPHVPYVVDDMASTGALPFVVVDVGSTGTLPDDVVVNDMASTSIQTCGLGPSGHNVGRVRDYCGHTLCLAEYVASHSAHVQPGHVIDTHLRPRRPRGPKGGRRGTPEGPARASMLQSGASRASMLHSGQTSNFKLAIRPSGDWLVSTRRPKGGEVRDARRASRASVTNSPTAHRASDSFRRPKGIRRVCILVTLQTSNSPAAPRATGSFQHVARRAGGAGRPKGGARLHVTFRSNFKLAIRP